MDERSLSANYASGDLTTELLLEALAGLGHCPNLLHDDGARWAFCLDSFQDLAVGKGGGMLRATYFVEEAKWKPSIREAILAGLECLG